MNLHLPCFEHLLTTRPHDIAAVLVSDLHLSQDTPALTQAFLALLEDLLALPKLKRLFILGDWLEVWIGDDAYLNDVSDNDTSAHTKPSEHTLHWLTPVLNQLKQLQSQGCEVLVMHGNRDFLLRQPFCNVFAGTLIAEPYDLMHGDTHYRLMHGDALCTADKGYQRFRKVTRNPLVQWYFLRQSLAKRQHWANQLRQKSKTSNQHKYQQSNQMAQDNTEQPMSDIMDVTPKAVQSAMAEVDVLIHGHTHRPAVHALPESKTRLVLGDWRTQKDPSTCAEVVVAEIAVLLTAGTHAKASEHLKTNEPPHRLVQFCHRLR